MIIISQDKMEIFNFEEIFRLYVDNWSNEEFATEPNCFCIRAEKSSDNMIGAYLGEYKTEERAKEVLQEIIKYESLFELSRFLGAEKPILKKYIELETIFGVYEMPIN